MVAMAGEQVASSLKRVCLRLALTGRQLRQTLDHGCPGDDLTHGRASPPNARMSGQAAGTGWQVQLLLRQRREAVRALCEEALASAAAD